MTLDRLSAEDIRILNLETGNVRGHVCKVLVLEPGPRPLPTVDDLRAHIDARLDAAPRLRRRLVKAPFRLGTPVWVDDADFDIARHVRAVEEPAPIGPGRLREIVAALMAERLDRERPLWRLDVVEGVADGTLALVWRIHHCMADGATAMKIASEVLWTAAPDAPPAPASTWRPAPPPHAMMLLADGAASGVTHEHGRARGLGAAARGPADARRRAHEAKATVARDLAWQATPTPLDHVAGAGRRIAFASAPLADCRRAGKAIDSGITVNDIVLAAVAGGMRAWLEHRGLPAQGIRAKVPVSLHDASLSDGAANRDSYFFVDLPVDDVKVTERIAAVNRETTERKRAHEAEALYAATLRRSVARRAMDPHVFTLNISNVPGPREAVYVLGARVRELYSVAEIAEHHALRVAVISFDGTLFFGLCADRDTVADIDVIAGGIQDCVGELVTPA
jgi:WS/DGAT/MGAT family acyltransferase